MRRTRLYLDTSPIIMIEPDQDPIKRAITEEFFRIAADKSDDYELFISPVTVRELSQTTSDEKRKASFDFLSTLEYTELPRNDDAENLARTYITDKVLSKRHILDLTHVAYAVVFRCDYIITWNMRNLANLRTMSRVNSVNASENYGKITIATPEFLTGDTTHEK